MPDFTPLSERELCRGHSISMAELEIEAPDGRRFSRDVVRHPGAVSIVAVDVDGRAVLVRQYRAAVDMHMLEIPAGKRDVDGEEPAITAHRELAEEVGLEAAHMEFLVEFYNSPGFCDEHSLIYLATDLTEVPPAPEGIEEEAMQIERVHLDDIPALISSGELVDGKSIIGLLTARERLTAP